jgi:7-carboxy-7-deazaguanine synthase
MKPIPSIAPDPRLDLCLKMTEVYKSIQGESTWAGLPCVFLRTARCNLRCTWCDTTYSFEGGESISIGRLIEQCEAHHCPLIEITGGEPLVQPNVTPLSGCLVERGYTVLVETSGSLPINVLPEGVITIMDIKCPGSGEAAKNHWPNIEYLGPRDEVKFVVADRADYEWSREVIGRYDLAARCHAVLMSPVIGSVAPPELAQWIVDDGLPVRFQLQLHKLIWPPDQRGV